MDSNFKNRMVELANRSYQSNTFVFTNFLGLAEQSDLIEIDRYVSFAGVKLSGGYEGADRCMARFGNSDELGYEEEFPIACLHISPLVKKFADDLTHRDFLGAIMNLGIERDTIGDIKVNDKEAYVFCIESIAEYICDNLDKVRHTNVKIGIITDVSSRLKLIETEEPKVKQIVVSSLRADGIISKAYNLSRGESLELFQNQKVFINGRLVENNSMQLGGGDIVNARGYGKFRIDGLPRETKKGRISVSVAIW